MGAFTSSNLRSGAGAMPPAPAAPTAPVTAGMSVQQALDRVGIGRFAWVAGLVLGLANAADAVELLLMEYVLPLLD